MSIPGKDTALWVQPLFCHFHSWIMGDKGALINCFVGQSCDKWVYPNDD